MKINGEIIIDTPEGRITIPGNDLQTEGFDNGKEIELNYDTGEWSVRKIFGGEPGRGDGDWEEENCTIVSENISIEYIY